MTTNNIADVPFPEEPHEIPVSLIDEPQDCIDFGTVEFNISTVVNQGAKRGVIGECVVTGRKFEAVYLYRDVLAKDREIASDEPMHRFYLDRVWQYNPSKVVVDTTGRHRYGALNEMSVPLGVDGVTLGPIEPAQAPGAGKLHERFTSRFGGTQE